MDVTWTATTARPRPKAPHISWTHTLVLMTTVYLGVADGHTAVIAHDCEQKSVAAG